jgi:hypothetical protein
MGRSNFSIAKITGFSPGQINYRLKQVGITRADYRNGTSAVSRTMFRQMRVIAEPIVRKQIVNALKYGPKPRA